MSFLPKSTDVSFFGICFMTALELHALSCMLRMSVVDTLLNQLNNACVICKSQPHLGNVL